MKRNQILATVFWIANGLLVGILSWHMGVGSLRAPGPGLMPLLVSCLLLLISFYRLGRLVVGQNGKTEMREQAPSSANGRKLILITAALFAYTLLLEKVGFLITAFLLFSFLFRAVGVKRWIHALADSALTVSATYV